MKEPKQGPEKRPAFRWKVLAIAVGAGALILTAALLCTFHWYGPVSSPFTDWWAEPSEEGPAWEPMRPLERERIARVAGKPDSWLVMVYADGDAEDLEEGTLMNLNEAELVGSTDAVKVVAQVDRYFYGYDGDGDWTGTRRYLLTQDSDLFSLRSPVIGELGEADMGARQTLYDFATWAISTYPAEHYALIMSDHGGGWTGGWVDYDPKESAGLSMQQIDHTLAAVRADTGIEGFELVGLEACLMGQVEVMSALAKHARYAVASESTAWETGWAWAGLLWALVNDPTMTGRELAESIVSSYVDRDVCVTDDAARRYLTGDDSSAREVREYLWSSDTVAAIDLSRVRDLHAALNDLAVSLVPVDQAKVAKARAYAQSYGTVSGNANPNEQLPPSVFDLGSFARLLEVTVGEPRVSAACERVQQAIAQAVVAERHGPDVPGSTGLAVYFPVSAEYWANVPRSDYYYDYAVSVRRFAIASLWDDYLAFHYTKQAFDAGEARLAAVTPLRWTLKDFCWSGDPGPSPLAEGFGPGAGEVSIAPITASRSELAAGQTVTVSTKVEGKNVARVYWFVAYRSADADPYRSVEGGSIEAERDKVVGGVTYPDWGDGEPTPVEFEWMPSLYYIDGGTQEPVRFAFSPPDVFGNQEWQGALRIPGIYDPKGDPADENEDDRLWACMTLDGEGMRLGLWVYGPDELSGVYDWREMETAPGDIFTVTNDFVAIGQGPGDESLEYENGDVIFGEEPFTLSYGDAVPGKYAIGIGVEDFDGGFVWEYAYVTVIDSASVMGRQ